MPNRLARESSLYLRQHANNPVDWFPWGPEALARAREANRPIFLSVGYSACHWCHVMEHESFENDATAAIMNAHFVCVKVDREERPDLDQIYMTAHHLLNKGEGGGWPLSVFLTPDLTPFYAGTYYPPADNYGRPGFPRLLTAIANAWETKPAELAEVGAQVAAHLKGMASTEPDDKPLSADLLANAAAVLKRHFDFTNGGFGFAPKFPHPMELRFLLRCAVGAGSVSDGSVGAGSVSDGVSKTVAHASGSDKAPSRAMATLSLEKMARGGLYDQIGGGFARYSVDAVWLVPHFEKMLYDNALLPPAYTEAFLLTGDPFFRRIARETLDFIRTEMTHPDGGFYSTLDADSEGEEGKFYVWSEGEIDAILGAELGHFARAVFGTSPAGNFEGHNILCRARTDEEDARAQRLSAEGFRAKLDETKAKLYAVRAKRVWPGRDEKVLTAWNGLMIAAFAQAGTAFGEPEYVHCAERATAFVLKNLRDSNGRLFRTWGEGVGAKLTGYLEDYSHLIDALVSVYEATFDPKYVATACELADAMLAHFADPAGGFFFTADDHEPLLARTKDLQDGSVPSGNAMAATGLARLAKLTGNAKYRDAAEGTLKAYRSLIADSPMAAGQLLIALDFHLARVEEIAVVGPKADPETVEVLTHLRGQFKPNRVIAFHDPATGDSPPSVPLLAGKPMVDGKVTVYVCRDFACQAPLAGLAAVKAELR